MKTISIVTPCFNEEANIEQLYKRVKAVVDGIPQYSYELIFIDNASTDNTVLRIKELIESDNKVRLIVNARNLDIYGLLTTALCKRKVML